ncbi:MAG: hypothetical protein QXL02_02540 [Candidatus Anstonellales archaeon]
MIQAKRFAEIIYGADELHGELSLARRIMNTKNEEKLILNTHKFLKGIIIKSIPHEHRKLLIDTDAEFGAVQLLDILLRLILAFENPRILYLGYGYMNQINNKSNYYTDIVFRVNDVVFEFSPNPYGRPLFLKNPIYDKSSLQLKVYMNGNYLSTMIRPNAQIKLNYKNYFI